MVDGVARQVVGRAVWEVAHIIHRHSRWQGCSILVRVRADGLWVVDCIACSVVGRAVWKEAHVIVVLEIGLCPCVLLLDKTWGIASTNLRQHLGSPCISSQSARSEGNAERRCAQPGGQSISQNG